MNSTFKNWLYFIDLTQTILSRPGKSPERVVVLGVNPFHLNGPLSILSDATQLNLFADSLSNSNMPLISKLL